MDVEVFQRILRDFTGFSRIFTNLQGSVGYFEDIQASFSIILIIGFPGFSGLSDISVRKGRRPGMGIHFEQTGAAGCDGKWGHHPSNAR